MRAGYVAEIQLCTVLLRNLGQRTENMPWGGALQGPAGPANINSHCGT